MENFTNEELITLLAILGEQTNNTVNQYIEILDFDKTNGEYYDFGENYIKPRVFGLTSHTDRLYNKVLDELNKRKVMKQIFTVWI